MLLLVLPVATILRAWHLGQAPPGLYRDEAYNGLDALDVLQGQLSLFFTANNGREPAYIYLTSLAVAIVGRSALAVRLAAAVSGILMTLLTYHLGRTWFDRRVGFLAAWLWAVTLWPVHLSRIGLRPILLAPFLTLTFWLGTEAYRRQRTWLWMASGAAYGFAFYTYLAVRFTPILLFLLLSYILLSRPRSRRRLWPGVLWFLLVAGLVVLPLAIFAVQHPHYFLGRVQQVSVLNPELSEGPVVQTLLRQTARALGMFLWRGDAILRHNPAGRPVFDLYMIVPFLLGLFVCLRRWRRAAAVTVMLWLGVMLGPTILAEDAPHFLRAVGVLPVALFLPALGLSFLWDWPKLADALRKGLVLFLATGTLIATVSDYVEYVRQPETAYLFEAAARELAQKVDEASDTDAVYLERRFWEGWPSLPFLVKDAQRVNLYTPEEGFPRDLSLPVTLFAWPYESLAYVGSALGPPAHVRLQQGPLARGDLEEDPYVLYLAYRAEPAPGSPPIATFGRLVELRRAEITMLTAKRLRIDLDWSAAAEIDEPLTVFVHAIDGSGEIVGQSDAPPAQGYWPLTTWQPGVTVRDRHVFDLEEPYDTVHHQVVVGLYHSVTRDRLPATTPAGDPAGDSWLLSEEPSAHEEN